MSFDGPFTSVPPIDPNPRPAAAIPILVGGHSDAALDRAARLGDGWIAAFMSPDRVADAMGRLHRACERHQRDPSELWLACGTEIRPDGGTGGSGESPLDRLARYEELGIHHAFVRADGPSEAEALGRLDQWGELIAARGA